MHSAVRWESFIINGLMLAWCMHYYLQELKKEDGKMKDTRYTKRLAYMGAGCGVVLFAIFGLLPGSFLGGVMGLNIAGTLLGLPLASGVLSRLIVAASMVTGVMVSGIMFITASSVAGWLIGTVLDAITAEKKEMATVGHK
jgi:hypothetical protein